ncbi:MAG: DMT family transporter [Bellilinea sp.]
MQTTSASSQRIKYDGFLLLASLIWGSGFVAQRAAADSMGSFTFNGLRFLLGFVILLVVSGFKKRIEKSQWRWVILAGLLLFGASALQQFGLLTTTAANAGFITSLYVVIIPFGLWIFARQQIKPVIWAGVSLAAVGTLLLSTSGVYDPAVGDWFELAGAFLWAGHVLVVGLYGKHSDALAFSMGQFGVAAALNLISAGLLEWGNYTPKPEAWWGVLYSGIFPVSIAFTLQVLGQRRAPVIDAALIFSLEAVFAALFGYWLLNEDLRPAQLFGCGLILAALLLTQSQSFRQRAKVRPLGEES